MCFEILLYFLWFLNKIQSCLNKQILILILYSPAMAPFSASVQSRPISKVYISMSYRSHRDYVLITNFCNLLVLTI